MYDTLKKLPFLTIGAIILLFKNPRVFVATMVASNLVMQNRWEPVRDQMTVNQAKQLDSNILMSSISAASIATLAWVSGSLFDRKNGRTKYKPPADAPGSTSSSVELFGK